jgi:hypothetical protein
MSKRLIDNKLSDFRQFDIDGRLSLFTPYPQINAPLSVMFLALA